MSTDLAVLRRLLLGELGDNTELKKEVHAVKRGYKRLVVEVNRADVMAAMVRMKRDVAPGMAMTFMGGAEAWMVSCVPRLSRVKWALMLVSDCRRAGRAFHWCRRVSI